MNTETRRHEDRNLVGVNVSSLCGLVVDSNRIPMMPTVGKLDRSAKLPHTVLHFYDRKFPIPADTTVVPFENGLGAQFAKRAA
jgi:hypothetical protein